MGGKAKEEKDGSGGELAVESLWGLLMNPTPDEGERRMKEEKREGDQRADGCVEPIIKP